MIKKLAWLAIFCGITAFAQTTTYIGTVKDLTGATVTSGRITWTLNAPSGGNIPGTGAFVASTVSCIINASGAPKSSVDGTSACVITNNTSLTPTGTSYQLCIQPNFVTPGSCYTTFAVGGTVDISTLVPTPATQPNYGVASTSNANTWSQPQTFSGGFSGSTNSLSVGSNGLLKDGAQVINAKAYGAKGDGTTDDTTNLNLAATAAAGNVLYVPAGTYLISNTVSIHSNTTVMAYGATFKTASANPSIHIISNYNHSGDTGIQVYGLTADCNNNTGSSMGIEFYEASNGIIQGNTVKNCANAGIQAQFGSNDNVIAYNTVMNVGGTGFGQGITLFKGAYGNRVFGNYVTGMTAGSGAILVGDDSSSLPSGSLPSLWTVVSDNIVDNSALPSNCGVYGIWAEGNSNTIIENNHINGVCGHPLTAGSGGTTGSAADASQVIIAHNIITNTGSTTVGSPDAVIRAFGSHVSIDGNTVHTVGQYMNGIIFEASGVQVVGSALDVAISGNHIDGMTTGTGAMPCIRVSGNYPVSQLRIWGNGVSGCGGDAIVDLAGGKDHDISHNQVVNPYGHGIHVNPFTALSGVMIDSNSVRNAGFGNSPNISDGILLESANGDSYQSRYNRLIDDQGTHTMRWGIEVSGTTNISSFQDVVAGNTNGANGATSIGYPAPFAIPSTVTAVQGSTGTKLAVTSGSFTSGNLRSTDASGNEVDAGATPSKVNTCGTTTTCANTLQANPRVVWGTVALSGGTATVSSMTAWTSTSSFVCTGTDQTSAAAVKIVNASTSSITITGTGTDVIGYQCAGN